MTSSLLSSTEFSFPLVWKKRSYTVHAALAYEDSKVERWEVSIAGRLFYFQNNRPYLTLTKITRALKWQIIKGLEYIDNKGQLDDAVELMDTMWQQIEKLSMGKKMYDTFQDVRNKQG